MVEHPGFEPCLLAPNQACYHYTRCSIAPRRGWRRGDCPGRPWVSSCRFRRHGRGGSGETAAPCARGRKNGGCGLLCPRSYRSIKLGSKSPQFSIEKIPVSGHLLEEIPLPFRGPAPAARDGQCRPIKRERLRSGPMQQPNHLHPRLAVLRVLRDSMAAFTAS